MMCGLGRECNGETMITVIVACARRNGFGCGCGCGGCGMHFDHLTVSVLRATQKPAKGPRNAELVE